MPPTPNAPPPASPDAPPGPGSEASVAGIVWIVWLARLARAWAWAGSRLGHLVALLALASIPGASLRPLAPELEAPPLPADVGDRSAVLEVDVHQRGTNGAAGPALAGARVRAFTMLEGRAYLAADRPAPAGHVRLADLPPGEHWIVVDAAGFARVSRMVMLVSGERSLALDTPPQRVLDVDVVDEAGAPVSAASLEVSAGDPFPVGARSDDAGRALVTRLTEGPYVVAVSHPGYDPVEVRHPTDEKPLRVVLKKLGALKVTVLGPQGTPTAATVEITSAVLWPSRRADTDPEGKVRIGGLSAGSYSLRAVAGGLTSATELAVTLTQGQEREITLRLSQGMSVEVRVLDGESDPATPLVGARVALAESGLSAFPVEGVTGKSGAVTLGPIPHGGASVTVSRDDFVSVTVAVPDTPGPLVVVLPRAGTIFGRVVDGRGFPVDGARIEIVGTDLRGMPVADDPRVARARDARFDRALAGPRPLVPAGELGVMPGPLPDIPRGAVARASAPLASASPSGSPSEGWLTGRDGSFRARPVTPGRVRALVRHAQYVEGASELVDLAPGGTAEVKIVMRAGGLLEGRVVDAHDRPVEGAEITAMATRGTFERMTRADRDGAFAFAAMPEELTLLVERPAGQAGAPTRAEARVPEGGRASVRIVLPDPRDDLPARVLDARGAGVDGAQITVASLEPNVPLRATVFTSRRGEAKLAGAKGLALHVEVRAPRFAARSLELAADATELRVELAASESLTGEVRSARRDRLHDAEITVYAEDGAHRGRTDKDGEFTIRDVPPGPVRVRVRAAGFAPKTLEARVQETAGRRPTALPRVELDEEGIVEGLVVDGRGDPVPGARVAKDAVPVVLLAGPPPPGLAVADARGRFTLAELPQGLLSLEAYASGRGRGRGAVRVVPGRTTRDVRLVLDGEGAGASEPRGAGGVAVTLGEITASHEVGIASVVEGSAAERAGLEPGDILVEIAGVPVHTIAEARARLSGPLGDDVVVKLRRRGHLESRRVPREEVRK